MTPFGALSLNFALFYIAERFQECSANGASTRKECAGLLFLHTQLGFSCVFSTQLLDSTFAGYKRRLMAVSGLGCRRSFYLDG